jgi:hypothetical protein
MRRGVTVLVVVVVAAIALVAGIDALRGESDSEPAAETVSTSTTSEGPTNYVPLEGEPGGTLYYTDASCELKAIELPTQTPVEAPGWDECRFVLSPSGQRASGAGSGWDPRSDPLIGRLFQSAAGLIEVATNLGPEGVPFRGTAPAWRPDGTLTYFAGGAVREWPSGDTILAQPELFRALRQATVPGFGGFQHVRVREAAWLDDERPAAILSVEGPGGSWDVLTTFDDGGIQEAFVEPPGAFSGLRASPTGRYIAAGRNGKFFLAEPGRGSLSNLGTISGYRTSAFSPDERWVAVANERGVFILRPGATGRPELHLELDAHDLAWRGVSRAADDRGRGRGTGVAG